MTTTLPTLTRLMTDDPRWFDVANPLTTFVIRYDGREEVIEGVGAAMARQGELRRRATASDPKPLTQHQLDVRDYREYRTGRR